MRREKIKADLEILLLARQNFGDNDEIVRSVDQKVTHLLGYLYRNPSGSQLRLLAGANLVLCVLCACGAYLFASTHLHADLDRDGMPLFGAALLALFSIWSAMNFFDEVKAPPWTLRPTRRDEREPLRREGVGPLALSSVRGVGAPAI